MYELEQDANYTRGKSPQEMAEYSFNVVYNRNHKAYLASIEWDTWCEPNDPLEMERQLKEEEVKRHPFNKFF